ncbi:unnamed protein product [Adineta steineri]|uniref:C3H1-type domain-containing protein n=1 Tax=Adineta steineri TaxID=433720 RepID=A0A815HWJ5_9BILA|nr:unnamed protein product [Adineta steineri]
MLSIKLFPRALTATKSTLKCNGTNQHFFIIERPILLYEKELSVSRQLSRVHYLSHKITCGLKVKLPKDYSARELIAKVRNYFLPYGTINYQEYFDDMIYFIFDDYDSVDRIVLEKNAHRIKGIQLIVEKLRIPKDRRTIVTSDVIEYCIHVTNLPNDVNGNELSDIFRIDVANILIRPYNELQHHLVENNRTSRPVEVWIKDIGSNEVLQKLVNEKNGYCLRGCQIQCQVIRAPVNYFDFCKSYQEGKCSFSIGCRKKHIQCVEPIECRNTRCWYGHDQRRVIRSDRPNFTREDGYRVRISNFPPNVTRPEIFKRLWLRFFQNQSHLLVFNENDPSLPTIAYATNEKSLAFAKDLIHAWHDQTFSRDQPYIMQCQLEMDVDYYNSKIAISHAIISQQLHSSTPSVISSINSGAVRLTAAREQMQRPQSHAPFSGECRKQDQQLTSLALPNSWSLVDNLNVLTHSDSLYSIIDRTDSNRRALLKIYSTISDRSSRLRVERHRLALQRLAKVEGVPELIDCNYEKSMVNQNSWKKLWLITEEPKGTRLDVYLSKELRNFEDKMIIILELINLVEKIHRCEFHLQTIDFDFAHLINSSYKIQKINNTNLLPLIANQVTNNFYIPVEFEVEPLNNDDIDEEKESKQPERQSPTIDTGFICAILFWMITYHEPKAPHCVLENSQLMEDTLNLATNGCSWKIHCMKNHLQLIFDRAFDKKQQQQQRWSIDTLKYQIRFLLEVLNSMKEQDVTIENKSIIPSNESFIRLASWISLMKEEFIRYYSRFGLVHWSNNEKNQWSSYSTTVKNTDLLNIDKIQYPIKFEANQRENGDKIQIIVYIKINEATIVDLPIGNWHEKEIGTMHEIFLRELTIFCQLLL